jgi:hypothetical protein
VLQAAAEGGETKLAALVRHRIGDASTARRFNAPPSYHHPEAEDVVADEPTWDFDSVKNNGGGGTVRVTSLG